MNEYDFLNALSKKIGLEDRVYSKHKNFQLPEVEPNHHSQNKEYYYGKWEFSGGYSNTCVDSIEYNLYQNHSKCAYNGRIYYISSYKNKTYLCSSDFEGNDIKIITTIDGYDYDSEMQVNVTGIYISGSSYHYRYKNGEEYEQMYFHVKHISFDGKTIIELCDDDKTVEPNNIYCNKRISSSYIYDNKIYYVVNKRHYKYDAKEKCYIDSSQIRCIDITSKTISIVLNMTTKRDEEIDVMYVKEHHIFFRYGKGYGKKWIIFNSVTQQFDNFNDTNGNEFNIAFFDLNRDIFWTIRKGSQYAETDTNTEEVIYLEPRKIWGNRDEIISNFPVWKIRTSSLYRYRGLNHKGYFDGVHFYIACTNYFGAIDNYGNEYLWTPTAQGYCDSFMILGDMLFDPVSDHCIYPLSFEKQEPIRKEWFSDDLSEDVIDEYENPTGKKTISQNSTNKTKISSNKDISISQSNSESSDLTVIKTMGNTDMKYNICTFGSKFHIGFGAPVTIVLNGKSYTCKMHNSAKGRADGLKKLYTENNVMLGDTFKASYSAIDNVITLEKI